MNKVNKLAGFWIRFLARMLDYSIFIAIFIGLGYAFLTKGGYNSTDTKQQLWNPFGPIYANDTNHTVIDYGEKYHFASPSAYYSWLTICFAIIVAQFVLVPSLTKGRTIGMAICQIKIQTPQSTNSAWYIVWWKRIVSIFKREIFVGLVMGVNVILMMIIFDYDLFNKFSYFTKGRLEEFKNKYNLNQSDIFNSTVMNLRVALVTTFTSVLIIGQLLCGLSIILRKQKNGLHDAFSHTSTVWARRMIIVEEKTGQEAVHSFMPHLVKKETIEWIE